MHVFQHLCCFNSRAPRGARRKREVQYGTATQFQFTCPSRSTTNPTLIADRITVVSIHVPLAEHDGLKLADNHLGQVSIHVPLAEHDMSAHVNAWSRPCFNSRAPRGARLLLRGRRDGLAEVSIHVPLAEHDERAFDMPEERDGFNSRAPRGARPDQSSVASMFFGFQFTCPSRSTTSQTL